MSIAQRIRKPVSDHELNRRWNALRDMMANKALGCFMVQGSNMHLGGYVRYLTDIPAENNYHMTAFLPIDGELTLIRSSLSPIPEWALRGVEKVEYAPYSPSLTFTGRLETGIAVDYLRKRGVKRLGFAGKGFLTAELMLALRSELPQMELVDVTDEFDLIKALKSDEEMEFIRATARVQDHMFAALPAIIRPGLTEYQVRAEFIQLSMNLGTEEHLIFMGTAPQGKPCGMSTAQYVNRTINPGDYGTILMEINGPGGYYCESARNFSLGEPCEALVKAWDVAVKAQKLTADLMTPGRDAAEIVEKYNIFVGEMGYSQEGRLYGHSQGYDLIERPAFMAANENGVETMKIRAGMNCSVHPYFIDQEQTVYINDNFYITEHGAERIHETPQEMIII